MRTKLIIGLTTGLITAAQVGSAQTVSTVAANDEIFANVVVGYAEAMTAPEVKLQQNFTPSTVQAAAPQEVILADTSIFRHTTDASTTTPDFSVNTAEKTAAVAFALSSSDTTDSQQVTFAKRSYLDFGTGYSYPTLQALNQMDSVSGSFAQAGFSDVTTTSAFRELTEAGPSRASVSSGSSGTIIPAVATPEPGTLGLLFTGSSALVARLMFRRKKS